MSKLDEAAAFRYCIRRCFELEVTVGMTLVGLNKRKDGKTICRSSGRLTWTFYFTVTTKLSGALEDASSLSGARLGG